MWVEKGNGKLNNKTHYTEGLNERDREKGALASTAAWKQSH